MTVEAIKDAIRELSVPEMSEVAAWIQEMKEEAWDREIEEDFAPGGRAERLIARLDAEIESGNYTPYDEGLLRERARRG